MNYMCLFNRFIAVSNFHMFQWLQVLLLLEAPLQVLNGDQYKVPEPSFVLDYLSRISYYV